MDLAMDTMTILTNANWAINQLRRDALKRWDAAPPSNIVPGPQRHLLVKATNLERRIKAAVQGGKVARSNPAAFVWGRRYHPYMQVAHGYHRGRSFLVRNTQCRLILINLFLSK